MRRPSSRRACWRRGFCRDLPSRWQDGRSRSSRPRPRRRTTALAAHLRDEHGAEVVYVSGSLSDRRKLLEELEQVEAEVFLVELKAAAIDVVAEAARERGVDIVFAGSDVLSADGQDLDAELLRLAEEAT